jgi:hypothetical protein
MNTNTQESNNKIININININNMCDKINLFSLGAIPELEAVHRSSSLVEELIPDVSMDSLIESHDDLLFALKHTQEPESIAIYNNEDKAADNDKIPRKRIKTFHEHPIPEPMDISEFYSCCAGCVRTDGQNPLQYCRRAYPDRVIESYCDDSDEELEIDEYNPHRMFKSATIAAAEEYQEDENDQEDEEDEYLTELWILEQQDKRRYPRRRRPEGLEEIAVRLFQEEEVIMPVLEDEELIPPMPVLQRQNTQFTINGITVYNRNPNGSRFFDDEFDEDLV